MGPTVQKTTKLFAFSLIYLSIIFIPKVSFASSVAISTEIAVKNAERKANALKAEANALKAEAEVKKAELKALQIQLAVNKMTGIKSEEEKASKAKKEKIAAEKAAKVKAKKLAEEKAKKESEKVKAKKVVRKKAIKEKASPKKSKTRSTSNATAETIYTSDMVKQVLIVPGLRLDRQKTLPGSARNKPKILKESKSTR